MDDNDARTAFVREIRKYPRLDKPQSGAELMEMDETLSELTALWVGILIIGLFLLGVHWYFRSPLSTVVRWRFYVAWQAVQGVSVGLGFFALIWARTLLGRAAGEVRRGFDDVLDLYDDMLDTTRGMLATSASLPCDVQLVVNTTEVLEQLFVGAIDPLEDYEDQLVPSAFAARNVWLVTCILPLVVTVVLVVYSRLRSAGDSVAYVWGIGVQLPLALVVVALLVCFNVFLADFCFLGPGEALNNDHNTYTAYYLTCDDGDPNPIAGPVKNCSEAIDMLACNDTRVNRLQSAIDFIADATLGCSASAFADPVDDLFHDAVCDRSVRSLYYAYVVLATVGFVVLLVLAPVYLDVDDDYLPSPKSTASSLTSFSHASFDRDRAHHYERRKHIKARRYARDEYSDYDFDTEYDDCTYDDTEDDFRDDDSLPHRPKSESKPRRAQFEDDVDPGYYRQRSKSETRPPRRPPKRNRPPRRPAAPNDHRDSSQSSSRDPHKQRQERPSSTPQRGRRPPSTSPPPANARGQRGNWAPRVPPPPRRSPPRTSPPRTTPSPHKRRPKSTPPAAPPRSSPTDVDFVVPPTDI